MLNENGQVVESEWLKTSELRANVETDAYVVMPNHFHGVLIFGSGSGTARRAPTEAREVFGKPTVHSLPTVIRSFKAAVTKRMNDLHGTRGVLIWQRNYYEHVIRGESDLEAVRSYIAGNPLKWDLDPENPVARTWRHHTSRLSRQVSVWEA